MPKFESHLIKTDVTAVKIWNNHILAGIGGYLNLYELSLGQFTQKIPVFEGFKIHGIEADETENNVAVFGGIFIKIFQYNNSRFDLISSKAVFDWILSARWLKNDEIALVLMNNKLLVVDKKCEQKKLICCQNKCILYSGLICRSEWDQLIVFSGTVFNEILVWKPSVTDENGASPVSQRLRGHNGVIFCLSYNLNSKYLCSSSDDRSSILWNLENLERICLKVKVYGHQSRVYRCKVLDQIFVTAGEDSNINLWDFEGNLLKKIVAHQETSCIWSLDSNKEILVSGGGDCGVAINHITEKNLNEKIKQFNLPDGEIPKNLGILSDNSAMIVSENGSLFCYECDTGCLTKIGRHEDLRSYSIMQVSECRKQVSLSGYNGQIYIYRNSASNLHLVLSHTIEDQSRIFSFHWLSCELFFTCSCHGLLRLWLIKSHNSIFLIAKFLLPESKERWTTSACQATKGVYIVGDRKGHVYVYRLNFEGPVQILKRVHSHLGVTRLFFCAKTNELVSLGRDGIMKTFSVNPTSDVQLGSTEVVPAKSDLIPRNPTPDVQLDSSQISPAKSDLDLTITTSASQSVLAKSDLNIKISTSDVKFKSSDKLPFSWLANSHQNFDIILGFSGKNFLVWDCSKRRQILEIDCSGGHRSWDFHINPSTNQMNFSFIKDKAVHVVTENWPKLRPNDIVPSFHSSVINCARVIEIEHQKWDRNLKYVLISGGEDTSLRISGLSDCLGEFSNLLTYKCHLSSIRALCIEQLNYTKCDQQQQQEFLVFSAGGRSQMICWKFSISPCTELSCNQFSNYYEPDDERSETRIMDLVCRRTAGLSNDFILFAGCSDGTVQIFRVQEALNFKLVCVEKLFQKLRCITKVGFLEIFAKPVLLSMSTDGFMDFWDLTEIFQQTTNSSSSAKPFCSIKLHQSGINSFSFEFFNSDWLIFASGGDDNSFNIHLMKFQQNLDEISVEIVDKFTDKITHCAQITGLELFDHKYCFTCSIDQRIALFKWSIVQDGDGKSSIQCQFLCKYNTAVADVQGMECFRSDDNFGNRCKIVVYGTGIECLECLLD